MDLDLVEKIEDELKGYYEKNEPQCGKVNFHKENVKMAEHALRLPMKQFIFSENCRAHEYRAMEAQRKKQLEAIESTAMVSDNLLIYLKANNFV